MSKLEMNAELLVHLCLKDKQLTPPKSLKC